MTLRKQALTSIVCTAVVLGGVLYGASRLIILQGFSDLESHQVRRTMEQVMDHVSRETVSLDVAVSRWTAGKDLSEIARDVEGQLPGARGAEEALGLLRLNVLIAVNQEGQVVRTRSDEAGKKSEAEFVSRVKSLLPTKPGPQRSVAKVSAVSGLVLLEEGPMIVAVRPLMERREREPFRGALVAGRFLDLAQMENLAGGMKLTPIPFEGLKASAQEPDDLWCEGLSIDAPLCVKELAPDVVAAYALMADVSGRPAMVIRMDAPREIYERGRATVNYFLMSLVGVGLIFAAVTMLLLDRRITSRLADLSRRVGGIAARGDPTRRVDARGSDELSSVAAEINTMLASLQRSEEDLKAARDHLDLRVQERTSELVEANERLLQEIDRRMTVEEDLRASREELKRSLEEKEVLLREIHHRVKNNLQVMASLLTLQSGEVKDESILNVFRDAESRIWSMALVHETLYQSGNLARISTKEYVQDLVEELITSYGTDAPRIVTRVEVEDHTLGLDTAVPLGLIINELMANAFKHAFAGTDGMGRISIGFAAVAPKQFELSVEDNGVGMTGRDRDGRGDSFGMQLVKALVRQLDGELSVTADRGTRFAIRFTEADKRTRR